MGLRRTKSFQPPQHLGPMGQRLGYLAALDRALSDPSIKRFAYKMPTRIQTPRTWFNFVPEGQLFMDVNGERIELNVLETEIVNIDEDGNHVPDAGMTLTVEREKNSSFARLLEAQDDDLDVDEDPAAQADAVDWITSKLQREGFAVADQGEGFLKVITDRQMPAFTNLNPGVAWTDRETK